MQPYATLEMYVCCFHVHVCMLLPMLLHLAQSQCSATFKQGSNEHVTTSLDYTIAHDNVSAGSRRDRADDGTPAPRTAAADSAGAGAACSVDETARVAGSVDEAAGALGTLTRRDSRSSRQRTSRWSHSSDLINDVSGASSTQRPSETSLTEHEIDGRR